MNEALPAFQFYRETRFKEVELNGRKVKIPEEWEVKRLGALLLLLRNGLTKRQNKLGNGYPVTRIETIANEYIDPEKVGYIGNVTPAEIEKYRLIPGDILFSHINSLEHIGKTAIYEGEPKLLLHGMNLLLIRADPTKVYPYYLLMVLKFYRAKSLFRNIAKKAVNQASINQTELKKLEIPLPLLEEQKKIAEVLRSIDEAIQAVEESIAKLERLKKGTMEELLTRGIGHTSFKEVELNGRKVKIPEEWEVVELREVAERRSETVNPEIVGGLPFVGLEHIESGKIKLTQWGNSADVKSSKSKFYPGDILYGKLRPYLDKAVIAEFEGICSTDIIVIKTISDKLLPEYLIWVVHTREFIEYAKKTMKGVNHPRTSWNALKNFQIPLPPLPEQKQIAEILRTIDEAIETKRQKKEKLERMKKAVMEKLLTGEVRVR